MQETGEVVDAASRMPLMAACVWGLPGSLWLMPQNVRVAWSLRVLMIAYGYDMVQYGIRMGLRLDSCAGGYRHTSTATLQGLRERRGVMGPPRITKVVKEHRLTVGTSAASMIVLQFTAYFCLLVLFCAVLRQKPTSHGVIHVCVKCIA
jgi:hypothetical protein